MTSSAVARSMRANQTGNALERAFETALAGVPGR